MFRFSNTSRSFRIRGVIRKAILAASMLATIGLSVSVARADGWDGHWLCDSRGQCIWISDDGYSPNK
ncbi:hypothetical protein [Bradyrhizobium sp.]|uniref:hypothetical protein n=1 Tax=Bradyrhizobium sp. TaxID=376 RepID=UPI0039E5CE2F